MLLKQTRTNVSYASTITQPNYVEPQWYVMNIYQAQKWRKLGHERKKIE